MRCGLSVGHALAPFLESGAEPVETHCRRMRLEINKRQRLSIRLLQFVTYPKDCCAGAAQLVDRRLRRALQPPSPPRISSASNGALRLFVISVRNADEEPIEVIVRHTGT
jgi:hypothetical protein